ncbi:MAG: hypothetical protein E7330_04005 [Clostridiales bacterium]|nr:hypothetical protein [Clostridiales bacterium]
MEYFHGTITAGLTELKPFASPYSNLKEPLVYLTSKRQIALHYIWDTPRLGVKFPMLNIRNDGVLIFQEMFPDALRYFYEGVSGYIYCCKGDFSMNSASGVPFCATASEAVPVTKYEFIKNVYESILFYAEKGTFVYEHYEDLPQWRIDIIRGHITRFIKRNDLLHNNTHPSYHFIREKFPQFWDEAVVLSANGLF